MLSMFKNIKILARVLTIILLVSCAIWMCGCRNSSAGGESVRIHGMSIENLCVDNKVGIVITTGGVFHVDLENGTIEIRQRIKKNRVLAKATLDKDWCKALPGPAHNGFDYIWGGGSPGKAKMIISGDSVVRLFNIEKLEVALQFSPLYHKVNDSNGGLLALDNEGGVAIAPPKISPNKRWPKTFENNMWKLSAHEPLPVLFIGVCPPREFDWKRSKWPIVHYSSHIERYPSDGQIKEYSKFAKVLEMHQWVWKNRYVNKKDCLKEPYSNCNGNDTPLWKDNASWPVNNKWIADDEKELKRVVATAHACGMLIAVYFNGLKMDGSSILPEALRLKKKYNIDGIYLDGLLNNSNQGPLDAYLIARKLRILFGDDGWINFHNTHKGYFFPFIQTYMDFVTTSEHRKFDKWMSTTFNISNAIGGYWPEIPSFSGQQ